MGNLERISHKKSGIETELGKMTTGESYALQNPLALLMYNQKRRSEGLQPITLEPIHSNELTETAGMDEKEKERIALLREERKLQHEAFYKWADENDPEKLSIRYREYLAKYPEQRIDLNNPVDVETLFMFMFPPNTAQKQNEDAKRAFAQDLV
ncbi:hypothetical protein HYT05_04255 [Candidatus Kaiserbacteria bacterium]|nr:hypothetical protein [Candidatus Kaiserbacteria bacterium]